MIDIEELITPDLIEETLDNESVKNLSSETTEWMTKFTQIIAEKILEDEIRPIIENNVFQCQCLNWQGMEALRLGYCLSCFRNIRILVERQP